MGQGNKRSFVDQLVNPIVDEFWVTHSVVQGKLEGAWLAPFEMKCMERVTWKWSEVGCNSWGAVPLILLSLVLNQFQDDLAALILGMLHANLDCMLC